ncbi:hypothetical protein DRO42_02885 [Candidatus Bathyarchaeota archaeon]|mgnify:CR=1 FL=1|nr:MAG: hypothetical protein DRO42_02885 [Candidatus Bathyarchaeota archaeon]
MSEKLQRTPPYRDTKVSVERTKAQIMELLRSYGVEGIQWTEYRGEEDLKFIVQAEVKGVKRELMIQVKPPQMFTRRRVKGRGLVTVPHRKQAYRLLYYWLKSKLEAVMWGLSSIEQEFLSQVTVALPDGSTTVGDIMRDYIARDALTALPAPEPERKTVKAEVTEA